MKRLPRMKEGTLEVVWGNSREQGEDIYYVHGPGTSKADASLLHHVLACERRRFSLPGEPEYAPSLMDELKARGYDITTFRLTVKKLPVRVQPGREES